MKDKRIGNDIKVGWSIFKDDGSAFSLEGLNVSLYLKSMFGRKPLNDYVITGNIIQWTFYGKDQKSVGAYSLEMVVNEGEKGMITTDTCDFVRLVSCSCKLQGGEDAPNVETESIELTSTLDYVSGGTSVETVIGYGSAHGSALQTIEAETFTDKNELSSTYGQEVKADASGDYSFALGGDAAATAKRAVAQGHRCIARGETSHAEGHCAVVEYVDEQLNGYGSHAEGYSTAVVGSYSHAEGSKCAVAGSNSHAEGGETAVLADMAHAEGYKTEVMKGADGAHAEGNGTIATDKYSHAEGRQTRTLGEGSHAEGTETTAKKDYSHSEGKGTKSDGLYSHTEGISTETKAAGAHAEGFETYAKNECSHAEGHGAVASGIYAHAEGWVANAIGEASHAEGQNTRAHQIGSHSEGNNTDAKGPYSHAEGIGTKTKEGIAGQHVEGYYNKETDSLKVIGCGTSDEDRKNAVEVTQDGRVFVKGIGNYDGTSLEAVDLKTSLDHKANSGDVYNKTEMDNRIKADLVHKVEVATINGKSLINGGNIEISGGSGDYLPREEFEERIEGYATHDSVQELSENVTELSTRIDNIGEGGSSMFEAIKGETSYEEIKAAFEAKKVVYCHYDNRVYLLSTLAHNVAYFSVILGDYHYRLAVYPSNPNPRWGEDSRNFTHKLETLDNGNAKITIAGKSAEVATPQYVENAIQQSGGGGGTPSGEPMHYMFEAVGATYNATDADIPMVGIYGDSYVHKAKHWHLNELGDLTNDDMREIYAERYPTKTMRYMQEWFREANARTTLSSLTQVSSTQGNNIGYKAQCETMLLTADINGEIMLANLADGFYRAEKLRKILGILNMTSATAIGTTACYCPMLEYVRFKGVKISANLSLAPMLSNASILYMIENATATGITITLHADAYDRAMADSAITAAMESKQVNLAKA